ncbi:uncharacterized protein LOC120773076 [Bactrocera tryoni]|uniref:uncharacterized protein LOC120773076 n=1 Tax=Bactrocera tryoni TaxID=59916 RepID=UPI001A96AED4|nr:uncharacterized protein LOC120773076 [Bactrocera tryoni]
MGVKAAVGQWNPSDQTLSALCLGWKCLGIRSITDNNIIKMDIRTFFNNTTSKLKRRLSLNDSSSSEESHAADMTADDCHANDIGKWVALVGTMSEEQKKELLVSCWKPDQNYSFSADAAHLKRKYNWSWLDLYKPWLVCSRRLKGAFCLYCVLFKPLNKPGVISSFVVRPFTKFKNASSSLHKEATQSAMSFLNLQCVLYDLLMMRISVGDEALKNNLENGKQNAKYTSPQYQNEILDISAKVI